MKRRQFITLLGGAAAWPRMVQAQQPAMPVIGLLSTGSPEALRDQIGAFHQGLNGNGYFENRNVVVESHWAKGHYDLLPELAADLVRRQVAVIAASAPPAALAAKAATSTIPIVFMTGTDPLKLGLVASINRPGGNVTGATFFSTGLEPKWLQLLLELVPGPTVIGVLVNPSFPESGAQVNELLQAARTLGRQITILRADSERGIDAAFVSVVEQRIGGLVVASDPFFFTRRDQIVALAIRHAVPAIYQLREFAVAGGLMSYGTSIADAFRQAGIYTARILKGAQPSDLPVMQPVKFELVINVKTARTLGLDVPPMLLARADEVLE
jgi:putative tryptophan/tyrosine transport system substrate-binding protein